MRSAGHFVSSATSGTGSHSFNNRRQACGCGGGEHVIIHRCDWEAMMKVLQDALAALTEGVGQ